MKKIVIVLISLLAAATVRAQSAYSEHVIDKGIGRGDRLFSLFVGGANPMGSNSFNIEAATTKQDVKWGKTGVMYGVSILQFVHDFVGVGLEASGTNTTYAQTWVDGASYKTATSLWSGMVTGRLNLNPYQTVRVYVPAGVGLTYARNRWRIDGANADVEKSLSYGYFVGMGVETNFNGPDKGVGVEVRYHGFGADLDNHAGGTNIHGKKQLGYLAVLLKMNYRF